MGPLKEEWEQAAQGADPDGGQQLDAPGGIVPAAKQGLFGSVWEWTGSAFLPYPGFRPAEGLKLVASLNVGVKERVVVVEVNGQQLLLGVSAGGISTLHVLPEPLPDAPAPQLPQLPHFAHLLAQKLRKDS